MQFEETVHGYPEAVAVVHLLVRLEILSPQVKSGPQRGSRLWLRPQAALWISRYWRLNTIFDRTKDHLIDFVQIAFISILSRRLIRLVNQEISA